MTYTLEDYLVGLHTGSWFTWTDSSSKVYANLILAPVMNNAVGGEIANPYSKPSESDCTAGVAALQAAYDGDAYARSRELEYPSIADQLDDIYHNGIDAWKATIKVTKDKYPKG